MEERMEKESGCAGAAGQKSEAGGSAPAKVSVQVDEHRIFMRKNYAFFGGASALYALFYAFCLYRNASGITWPFFVAGTLVYFYSCTRRSGVPWNGSAPWNRNVPWKKDSIFYLVSILLLGVSVFLTDNIAINNVTKAGIFLLVVSMMLHQYLNDERWNLPKYLL